MSEGSPLTLIVTPPLEPFNRLMSIVSPTENPCGTASEGLSGRIRKSGGTPPGLSKVTLEISTRWHRQPLASVELVSVNWAMSADAVLTWSCSVYVHGELWMGTVTVSVSDPTALPSASYAVRVTSVFDGGLDQLGQKPTHMLRFCA